MEAIITELRKIFFLAALKYEAAFFMWNLYGKCLRQMSEFYKKLTLRVTYDRIVR